MSSEMLWYEILTDIIHPLSTTNDDCCTVFREHKLSIQEGFGGYVWKICGPKFNANNGSYDSRALCLSYLLTEMNKFWPDFPAP